MPIVTSSRRWRWLPHRPSGSRVAAGWKEVQAGWMSVRTEGCNTREPDGLCGNQRYRRELLMMGIMVPETC